MRFQSLRIARRAVAPALAAPLLAAGLLSAPASAETGAAPDAAAAIRRMLDAHRTLGPARIRIVHEELKDGRTQSRREQTVQRNDAKHYIIEFTDGGMGVRMTANGDSLVVHNLTRNAYRRSDNRSADLAMPFSRIRDEIARRFDDPKVGAALKAARVSRATVAGQPVYRLDWKAPVRLGSLPLRSLSIGAEDGLMHEALLQDDKAALRARATYTPRSIPWPAETFEFTPPPGAEDLNAED